MILFQKVWLMFYAKFVFRVNNLHKTLTFSKQVKIRKKYFKMPTAEILSSMLCIQI